jgi:hypothetical protein
MFHRIAVRELALLSCDPTGGRGLSFFRENLLGIVFIGIVTSVLGTFAYRWLVPDTLGPPPTVIQQPVHEIIKVPPAVSAAPNPKTIELEFWHFVSKTDSIEQYRKYVRRYPNGDFVGPAEAKIAELTAKPATPPPATGTGPGDTQPPPKEKKCVPFNGRLVCE